MISSEFLDVKLLCFNNFYQVSEEKKKKQRKDGNFARKSGSNYRPTRTMADEVGETTVSASEHSGAESMEWAGIFSIKSSSAASSVSSSATDLVLESEGERRPIKKERETSDSSLIISNQSLPAAKKQHKSLKVEPTARKSTRIEVNKRKRESDISDASVQSIPAINPSTSVQSIKEEGRKIGANSETQEKPSNRRKRCKPVQDSTTKNRAATSVQEDPVASTSGTISRTFHQLFTPNSVNPYGLFQPTPREDHHRRRIIAKRILLTGAVQYLYESH